MDVASQTAFGILYLVNLLRVCLSVIEDIFLPLMKTTTENNRGMNTMLS